MQGQEDKEKRHLKMKKFKLGIDIGTTRVKAMVVDSENKIVSFAAEEIKLHARDDFVEQDPEEIWGSVVKVIRKAISKEYIKKGLSGLSLSTQGGTLILIDREGNNLRPAISWMDTRAIKENENLIKEHGAEYFYRITGWVPYKTCLPLSQLIWIYKNEPEVFRNIHKCHFVDSYIIYRLTGKEFMDYTNAAITMLFNIQNKMWDEELLKLARIKAEQLPALIPSGRRIDIVKEDIARILDIPSPVFVYSGGHDQYCSALGAFVNKPGDVLLSTGTAWVILAITNQPIFSPKFEFSPGPHVIEGLWGALASVPYGGASYDWFLKNILLNKLTYKEIEELVNQAKGEMPVFRPFFSKGNKSASFSKLKLSHNAGHFLKAIMEGIALEVRRKLSSMKKSGIKIKNLKIVGGCARSSLWLEVISQVLALPFSIPPTLETASLGASLLVEEG